MIKRLCLPFALLLSLGCSENSTPSSFMADPHPTGWVQGHGPAYAQAPSGCVSCHGSTSVPSESGGPARTSCFSCHNHTPNAPCASCHLVQQALWSSASDRHAASVAAVLTNPDHNSAELLNVNCLKCHASFQVPAGIGHFVTPLDQVGQPAGTWTALNPGDWQATRCEVCHDPTSLNIDKLAKYGSLLDGPWNASYTPISALPAAYQNLVDPTGAVSTFTYPDQTTLPVQATRLCNSCHDPADQGAAPNIVLAGVDYGPQGGDSRAFVTTSHQGLGCIDCHPTHDFTPLVPETAPSCSGASCHSTSRIGTLPGKVHINHL